MQNILVIGAGRSTYSLINYLLFNANEEDWKITVADISKDLALSRTAGHKRGEAIKFDVNDDIQRVREISKADIVVSMLPASMHLSVAKDCIALGKHMVTASYVSDEMQKLDKEAKRTGVIIMNEIGVDPGIDHMSAMKVIDQIRESGGNMKAFESFTGGLVAPESDDNPWHYKFSWNPRNVVIAGSGGTVKFIQEGKYKYIPYHQVFRRTEIIKIDKWGDFEGYANRDSLKYREVYGLNDIPTIYRGTLRRKGFCRAWDCFVKLGATDDSFVMEGTENMTYRDFINSFLAFNPHDSVEMKLRQYLKIDQDDVDLWEKLEWLDIFSNKKIGLKSATPAQILQQILEQKWTLRPDDKDMLVMWHKFEFEKKGKIQEIQASMVHIGQDRNRTAMANTVGLPVAIATKMILNGKIKSAGIQIPIKKEVYEPILEELEEFGIYFTEKLIN